MAKKKLGLIIIDGLGLSKNNHANAWKLAQSPTLDSLLKKYPYSILQASGSPVGLPQGQAGNSEIGHLNIGAGRTIKAELVRINEDIASNKFVKNVNLLKAIKLAKAKHANLHIMGLTSAGGTHSQIKHIYKVLEVCGKAKIKTILHCWSDGRDEGLMGFIKHIPQIKQLLKKYPTIQIGTVSGRYYSMDRNKNWSRTQKAVNALLHKGKTFSDLYKYVKQSYKNKITDEFIVPSYNKQSPTLKKNDIVFIANFRPDRVRQICHLIKKSKLYSHKSNLWPLHLKLVTMVKYDGIDSDIVLYPAQQYPNTLGKVLETAGLKQLRIAETEKYAHVTFFLDGGKEYNYKKEKKILIPSPNVATYDLKPQMSALTITKTLLKVMNQYDVIICNFANCDMVGHTGNLKATIKAVETIDSCLKQLIVKAKQISMTLFITADHGNCDQMKDAKNQPLTSHTNAPVFFVSTDKSLKLKNGSLANIAPTILKYLKIKQPRQMDKKALY